MGSNRYLILQWGVNNNLNATLTLPLPYTNANYIFTANSVAANAPTGGINIIAERSTTKLTLYTYQSNSSSKRSGWSYTSTPLQVTWLTLGW